MKPYQEDRPERRTASVSDNFASAQSTLREILWVAVPKTIGGVSQMLFSLVLVRFMGPVPFGLISVCLTGVLLLDAVFGSAIDMAIFRLAPLYREENPIRARQIEKAGLYLKPAACILLLLPLVPFLGRISVALFQDPGHVALLISAFAALVGLLMFRSMQVHLQIERRFVAYGVSDLLHTIARFGSIFVLLLLVNQVKPERILGVYFLAAVAVTAIGLVWLSRPVLAAAFTADAARELAGILKWFLPAVVAGSIASRMDMFLVSSWGGVAEAGIYGAAQMFALVPQLLGSYAAAVLSPRILPMWRKGRLMGTFMKCQALLAVMAVGMFLLAWIATGPLGRWILPEAYARSRTVILFLLPAGLASFINFPIAVPLLLYTRPKLLLCADLFSIPLAASAYVLAIPGKGAVAAAAITSGFALLRLALYQMSAYRLLHRDPSGVQWSAQETPQVAGSLA